MLTQKELGIYLKELRKSKDLSLRRVDELTDITYSHLNMIENGIRKVTPALLKNLATLYNVDYLDLYEKAGYIDLIEDDKKSKIDSKPKGMRIPVLGSIPAGIPMEMIEDIVDWEDISEEMLKGGKQYFALKIKGDSMFPEYLNGDTIIVLKQDNCENGQDCVVAVNGDDATFKRIFKYDNGITLQPLNNTYMPMFYSNEDILNKPVKILGIVKQIRRNK